MVINSTKIVLIILASLSLIAPFMIHFMHTQSMMVATAPIVVFIIIIFVINPINLRVSRKIISYIFLSVTFISLISLVSLLSNQNFYYEKFLGSSILLIIYIVSALIFPGYIQNLNSIAFDKILKSIFYILTIDGLYTAFTMDLSEGKSTVFFGEPSHYALMILPFFLFYLLSNKQKKFLSLFVILLLIAIALLIQNLTLLVGVILASFVVFNIYKYLFFVMIFLIPIIFILLQDLDYFTSRLLFFGDNITNLSTLVFLSGWERALLNLKETYGIGIGFNQLGYIGSNGIYMDIIYSLIGIKLNYNDGGTTGSKMISELGIFGLLLLLIYIYFVSKFILLIKKNLYLMDSKDIFFLSVFIMYAIELFVRGAGYFTPTTFLFFASIFYINKNISMKY